MAETADSAVLAAGLEAEDAESLGDDHLLDLVIGRGDTLEDLQSLHRRGTTGSLVGHHASDGLVEDAGGGAEVEGTCSTLARLRFEFRSVMCDVEQLTATRGLLLTTSGGVVPGHLAEVSVVLDYRATQTCQLKAFPQEKKKKRGLSRAALAEPSSPRWADR